MESKQVIFRGPYQFWIMSYENKMISLKIFFIQTSTKLSSLNSFVVRSLWGSPFLDWVVLDAINIAGGVLLVWDKRVFEKVGCAVGRFSINVLFKGVVDDFVWACSGVYRPNEDSQRGALWEELSRMHSRWNTA